MQCCPLHTVCGLVDSINLGIKAANVNRVPRILAYPNSGEVYDGKTRTWIWNNSLEGKSLADYGEKLVQKGVSVIGGCCRVGPSGIK